MCGDTYSCLVVVQVGAFYSEVSLMPTFEPSAVLVKVAFNQDSLIFHGSSADGGRSRTHTRRSLYEYRYVHIHALC